MKTLEDFKVGDVWIDGDDNAFRIIAIDHVDFAYPVIAKGEDGHLATYSPCGQFSDSPGPFDLVRKAPRTSVRYVSLFRNADGKEIVETSLTGKRAARMTGYEHIATMQVEFTEGTDV